VIALQAPAKHGIDQIDLTLLIELEDVHIRQSAAEVHESGRNALFKVRYRKAAMRVIDEQARALR